MNTWRVRNAAMVIGTIRLDGVQPPPFRLVPVYVWSGWAIYHVDQDCSGPDPHSAGQARDDVRHQYWTNCDQAHRSRLHPCSKCSSTLSNRMAKLFGEVTADEKSRRRLPPLTPADPPPTQRSPASTSRDVSDVGLWTHD
jgi:hypothetical protein